MQIGHPDLDLGLFNNASVKSLLQSTIRRFSYLLIHRGFESLNDCQAKTSTAPGIAKIQSSRQCLIGDKDDSHPSWNESKSILSKIYQPLFKGKLSLELSIHLFILFSAYSTQGCREPGIYPKGLGAQSKVHPGQGTNPSQGTIT